MNRILEQWPALLSFFQTQLASPTIDQLSKSKAKSIMESMVRPSAKLYYYFLSYILKVVNDMNKEFQSEGPKIHVLYMRMTTIFKSVLQNFIKKDVMDRLDISTINLRGPTNYLPIEQLYLGAQVHKHLSDLNASDVNAFRLSCLNFYISLAESIRGRFDFKNELLKFVGAFCPTKALSGNVPDVFLVIDLISVFNLDEESINHEWRMLSITPDAQSCAHFDVEQFWFQVGKITNHDGTLLFSNIAFLAKAVLCLPQSSANVERILIKTKREIASRQKQQTPFSVRRIRSNPSIRQALIVLTGCRQLTC